MRRPIPFVSRVRLRNYKSIAECDVSLSPLTVLAGPNGSGKSNFLDALAFLADSLYTTLYLAVDKRGGLPEFVRRVPIPTDLISIEVDVSLLWGSVPVSGSYGFEIGRLRGDSFEVVRERCRLEWSGALGWWERNRNTVRNGRTDSPVAFVEPDRLYLPVAGSQLAVAGTNVGESTEAIPTPFTALAKGLAGMSFYDLSPEELRQPQPTSSAAVLGSRGEHLANVLGALDRTSSSHRERLDAYLAAILETALPEGARLEQWFAGPADRGGYTIVQLHSKIGTYNHQDLNRDVVFGPNAMSDGTIRAAGVLAALFQPATFADRIPLVGIEEPETALHPAAAGVLYDALTEASAHVQVITASQSADLLDRDDLDPSVVRAVTMEQGLTSISEIDAASREIVDKRLYTLGELMRGNQIQPRAASTGSPN